MRNRHRTDRTSRGGGDLRAPAIAAVYAVGSAGLLSAGVLLAGLASDRRTLYEVGLAVAFSAATGLLLFLLLRRNGRAVRDALSALDLQRIEQQAERSHIERIARIGHWIWRPGADAQDWQGGRVEHSESAASIFGVDPAALAISNEQYLDRFVHEEDRERVAKAFADIDNGYTLEYRIRRPDGSVRMIFEIAENVHDREGRFLQTQGTMQDITEQRQTERALLEYQGRLNMALRSARAAFWELDPRTGSHRLMDSYYAMLGYAPAEQPKNRASWLALLHPGDAETLQVTQHLPPFDSADHECEYRVRAKDGSWRWLLSRFRAAAFDELGHPSRIQGIDADITARKEAEMAVALERNRARLYLDVAGAILVVLDRESRIVLLNKRGCETLGVREKDAVGKNWFDSFSPAEEREAQRASYAAFLAGQRGPSQDIEMTLITAANEIRLVSWRDSLLLNEEGRVVGGISSGEDITVRRQLEKRLQELATRDELTGAFNRRHFMTQAPVEIERARRFGRPLSFIFVDLDHFKAINDRHGHAVGDEVLRSFSRLGQRNLRPTDVFARFGGEEFVVMMPETGLEQARQAAERLRSQMRELQACDDPPIKGVTASFGVAELLGRDQSIDQVLERVDQAAYRAKKSGRDRIEIAGA